MKLPPELLLLLATLHPTNALPIHRRSASFRTLRGLTSLTHDYSTHETLTHPAKFFHESTFSQHYDGRFASTELPHHTRLFHLRLLLKAYMHTMERIGVRTWLVHGCLLGWWWNGKIMPWDNDVDVMVDEGGMGELGGWWNMSVHHFSGIDLGFEESTNDVVDLGGEGKKEMGLKKRDTNHMISILHEEVAKHGKKYLLEVNPHYSNTSTRDEENVIDARWIDTSTGLFIDITTVHIQPSTAPFSSPKSTSNSNPPPLYTKDQHAYPPNSLFPLRPSTFESIPVLVPFDYTALLVDEYGPAALTQRRYKDFVFDAEVGEWVGESGFGFGKWGDEEDEEGIMERRRG
ncbi:hypothetical protein CC86DRAFT_396854 [Ophiobolus disseminans]|uniref:LicD/FKTN/FKRP nucleotidyltransferase domain-containing protein n=1 Tax=Ophiobolus disseminans TaxID=1469910 RepID=A0A6A6ZP49_9PLEO|nr:hypothetical protein CC86DRAFT_396854 [Ophiobolus disseminans]